MEKIKKLNPELLYKASKQSYRTKQEKTPTKLKIQTHNTSSNNTSSYIGNNTKTKGNQNPSSNNKNELQKQICTNAETSNLIKKINNISSKNSEYITNQIINSNKKYIEHKIKQSKHFNYSSINNSEKQKMFIKKIKEPNNISNNNHNTSVENKASFRIKKNDSTELIYRVKHKDIRKDKVIIENNEENNLNEFIIKDDLCDNSKENSRRNKSMSSISSSRLKEKKLKIINNIISELSSLKHIMDDNEDDPNDYNYQMDVEENHHLINNNKISKHNSNPIFQDDKHYETNKIIRPASSTNKILTEKFLSSLNEGLLKIGNLVHKKKNSNESNDFSEQVYNNFSSSLNSNSNKNTKCNYNLFI